MSRAIIVLGMHRSGTSALAGSLEQMGVYLGNVNSYSPDNVKGNQESQQIMILNNDLLASSGGSWDAPVSNVRWSALHKLTRDLIVDSFKNRALWGFKDPRTLLVLDGWLSAISSAELICIFRHPFLVAESLYKRNAISHERGLKIWLTYNRILKWHLEQKGNTNLIEFSVSHSDFAEQLNALTRKLNLPSSSSEFYDPTLKQTTVPDLHDQNTAKEALVLYEILRKMRDTQAANEDMV